MKRLVLIGLFACIAFSCEDEIYSNIPWAPVNLMVYLNDLDKDLMNPFSYKEFTAPRNEGDRLGYGGILVINGIGQDIINLRAFDLSCPVEAQKHIKIKPNDIGEARCPECGAVYNIASHGAPVSGTKHRLREYTVSPGHSYYTFRVSN